MRRTSTSTRRATSLDREEHRHHVHRRDAEGDQDDTLETKLSRPKVKAGSMEDKAKALRRRTVIALPDPTCSGTQNPRIQDRTSVVPSEGSEHNDVESFSNISDIVSEDKPDPGP
jgi:hypothetical protein